MQTTLLGEETVKSEEQIKEKQLYNWKWDRAIQCCENDVKAYADGQISYETTVKNIINVLDKVSSDLDRNKCVYQIYYIRELDKITPNSSNRLKNNGVPDWIKDATFKLLARAKKDDFSITKTVTVGRKTAFDKVAELLNDAGKLVTASQIASWYSNKPKENKAKFRSKYKELRD